MKPPVLLRIYLNQNLEGVKQFELKQIVIGRNAEVQLDLKDDSVSPLHAVIEERESGYYISDLGSQSGTFHNGQKILDQKLMSGDEIKIGAYKLQFFIGVPKPAGPPQPTAPSPNAQATPPAAPPRRQAPAAPPLPPEAAKQPAVPAQLQTETKPAMATVKSAPPLKKKKRKGQKTFAPASTFVDAREIVKPGKGTLVEVVVAWRERVIAARHFNEKRVVTVGADPSADVVIPVFAGRASFPLVKIGSLATVCVTSEMAAEVIRDHMSVSFSELGKQNKLRSVNGLLEFDIPQGEMVRISFQGGLLSIFVRYVPDTPKPLVAPLLDLTASEVTGVILAFVVVAILGLYMMIYAPAQLPDEARIEEPLRKAIVTFKPPPPKVIAQAEEKAVEVKKVVEVEDKARQAQAPTKENAGKPGSAGEVAPKPKTVVKENKVTSAKPGGATKTSPKEGASAASVKPDPTKVGLLNVFGSKGTQSTLNKTFSGQGDLVGLAENATGFAGNADTRQGDSMGTKLKDTGPGGKGTSTVGIAGVGTKGKGTGAYGLGTGGIGTKGAVDIDVGGQEAEFTGSIDREAIRRIIQQNKNAIRSCYERSLQRKPDLYGKLVLEWDIEDKGIVTRTAVKSNTLGDDQVATCIMGRIKALRFPEPPPEVTGRVTFPFVFSSQ